MYSSGSGVGNLLYNPDSVEPGSVEKSIEGLFLIERWVLLKILPHH
jgi:hypothetical protein